MFYHIFFMIFSGWLASKFGGKVLFGSGVFGAAILTLLTPLCATTSVYLLVAVRVLIGVCEVSLSNTNTIDTTLPLSGADPHRFTSMHVHRSQLRRCIISDILRNGVLASEEQEVNVDTDSQVSDNHCIRQSMHSLYSLQLACHADQKKHTLRGCHMVGYRLPVVYQ